MKIITLCTGNICRSPMAEGLLRSLVKSRGLKNISIDSAGTHNYHPNHPADKRAVKVMQAHGHNICDLRARVITRADVLPASSIILAAGDEHVRDAERLKKQAGGEASIMKMLDFHPTMPHADLADPYYGDEADFQSVYNLLAAALPPLLDSLTAIH